MRNNLEKKHNTKPERILGRLLQENKITFRSKVLVEGREVDFIIGNVAIEIDGHEQDVIKNNTLVELGYTPLHFSNTEIYNNRLQVINIIKNVINTTKPT